MRKTLFGIAILCILLILFYNSSSENVSDDKVLKETSKSDLKKIAKNELLINKKISELIKSENKNLPRMVDNETRLDTVTAGSSTQIIYSYTLPNYAASAVSSDWVATAGKTKVTKGVCTDVELQPLLLSGVSLIYVYKGNDDVYINQFQVSKPDCHTVN